MASRKSNTGKTTSRDHRSDALAYLCTNSPITSVTSYYYQQLVKRILELHKKHQ
jgi:hypothetical protein